MSLVKRVVVLSFKNNSHLVLFAKTPRLPDPSSQDRHSGFI